MFYTHRPLKARVDLFGFYRVASRLKCTKRTGWIRKTSRADVESVADHSLMTAMLALILAQGRELDAQRCAALAVVHDLAESIVGDLLPNEVQAERKHAMERSAIGEIAGILGDGDVVLRLYEEYEAGITEEARLVHQVDKLEMALQAISYYMDGKLGGDDACEFVRGALRYVSDAELVGHVLEALRASGLECVQDSQA
jgi:putative hydrolase of HD superfamily